MTNPNPPTWALFDVDLANTDEDELSALIDDVIDSGKALSIRDTRESEDIRAVCITWKAYVGLMSRALAYEMPQTKVDHPILDAEVVEEPEVEG